MLIRLVVVCLVSPDRCNSDIPDILGQISVDPDFSFRRKFAEERPCVSDEEFIAIWCFKGVVFVRKLFSTALKIRLHSLT